MDLLDKQIILALNVNCRTSYQALAHELGLSVNAVKKRINKLIETGVILEFYAYLSLAMSGGEILLAIITLEASASGQQVLDSISSDHHVFAGSILSDGRLLLFAEYRGALELDELGRFLHGLEGVTHIEMHTLLYEKGGKCELTKTDLKVLKVIKNNARMPIAQIAEHTELTPKRVRTVLKTLMGETGSAPEYFTEPTSFGDVRTTRQCVHFRILWNLNAAGSTTFIIRIDWDVEKGSRGGLIDWLQTEYPNKFWYALTSASTPTLFCVFVVEHLRDAEPLTQEISNGPLVASVDILFGYPTKTFDNPRAILLDQLIKEAGL
ncbi:MAG: winged helix-turn-helix transcriptional regulator [Candidatus Hermodarchaeia archaeon]